MNFYTILAIFVISTLVVFTVNLTSAQVDPLTEIIFLQTGELNTVENQFHISSEMSIREFFNGNIIRVSGQTIEGFPYITYSKISDDKIDTHGMIFIAGEFVDLNFEEKIIQKEINVEKKDDLAILVQYTQQVFSKKFANISMYIFDKEQNKLNDFYQKDGRLSNTDIEILVLDGDNQKFYSSNGITNSFGFFETEFWIPDNYKIDALTVTIDAENENSKSSKILQIFTSGNQKTDGASGSTGP